MKRPIQIVICVLLCACLLPAGWSVDAEPAHVPLAEPTAEPAHVPLAEPTANPMRVPLAEPTAEPTPTENPLKIAPVLNAFAAAVRGFWLDRITDAATDADTIAVVYVSNAEPLLGRLCGAMDSAEAQADDRIDGLRSLLDYLGGAMDSAEVQADARASDLCVLLQRLDGQRQAASDEAGTLRERFADLLGNW